MVVGGKGRRVKGEGGEEARRQDALGTWDFGVDVHTTSILARSSIACARCDVDGRAGWGG